MRIMEDITETTIPSFPLPRSNPFQAPDGYADARKMPGMLRVRMWDGEVVYVATRYDDIREVLGSPLFSAKPTVPGFPFISSSLKGLLLGERPFLTLLDGEQHTRQRRMVAKMFTYGKIQRLRDQIQKMFDDELDRLMASGNSADFYEDFALIVPPMYDDLRASMSPEKLAEHDAQMRIEIPAGGRNGDPEEDIAPGYVFLASDMSRYVTGQILATNGGLHMFD